MRAVGYVRVSTEKQTKSGLGLEDQVNAIEKYCEFREFELVHLYKEENGVSGTIPLGKRKMGGELIEACSNPPGTDELPIEAIVIPKMDRAFRDATDCLQTVKWWRKQGISLHIVDLGGAPFDTRSAMTEFMLTIMAAVSEMERNLISERTKAALAVKREQGYKTGGYIAYGYKKGSGGEMIPDAEEQKVIDLMVIMRRRGDSYRVIADEMNAQEKTPPKVLRKGEWSEGIWHPGAVRRTLIARGEVDEKTGHIKKKPGRPRSRRKTKKGKK